jgi:hypothetical protein
MIPLSINKSRFILNLSGMKADLLISTKTFLFGDFVQQLKIIGL